MNNNDNIHDIFSVLTVMLRLECVSCVVQTCSYMYFSYTFKHTYTHSNIHTHMTHVSGDQANEKVSKLNSHFIPV